MSSYVNIVLDFDGTLVFENSSKILIEELFSQRQSLSQRIAASFIYGHLNKVGFVLFAIAKRILRGRDARLALVLLVYRQLLSRDSERIFAKVASRLTLDTSLEPYYNRQFVILSTGLDPIIKAWLKLHPSLDVSRVVASGFDNRLTTLRPLKSKIKPLSTYIPFKFLTDHDLEMHIVTAAFRNSHVSKHGELYIIESTKP